MAMGKRERDRQPTMWVATTDLPTAASHPFYTRLNHLLHEQGFDDFVEAQCATHLYETGGFRRVHVRGHENVLKRLLIHAGAFNLGLWMRTLCGVGTPRSLQGRALALAAMVAVLCALIHDVMAAIWSPLRDHPPCH